LVTRQIRIPNPTDFAHEIRIRRMQILAGSVTSLAFMLIFIFMHHPEAVKALHSW